MIPFFALAVAATDGFVARRQYWKAAKPRSR